MDKQHRKIIIVGTKSDLKSQRKVHVEDIQVINYVTKN